MPETFSYVENAHNEVGWFFIACATGLPKDHPLWADCPELTVEFKVNGADVPFKQGVERIVENMKRMVEHRAAEMLQERADILRDRMDQLTSEVSDFVKERRQYLFPGVKFERD